MSISPPPHHPIRNQYHPTVRPCNTTAGATLTANRSLANHRTYRNELPRRVGFDRLVFTAKRLAYSPRAAALCGLGGMPSVYRRSGAGVPERGFYGRYAKYRHVCRLDAPRVVVLSAPRIYPCPTLQLDLTAVCLPYLITDLGDIRDVVDHVTTAWHEPLVLSKCELTVDFPASMFETLRRALYVPHVRELHRYANTVYHGSAHSPYRVKLYPKTEAGCAVARLELTLRRDALRPLGVDTVFDLAHASWSEILMGRVRFLEFRELANPDPLQARVVKRLQLSTVNEVLRGLRASERSWFHRRLAESRIAEVTRNALRALQQRLEPCEHSEACDCALCTPLGADVSFLPRRFRGAS